MGKCTLCCDRVTTRTRADLSSCFCPTDRKGLDDPGCSFTAVNESLSTRHIILGHAHTFAVDSRTNLDVLLVYLACDGPY